MAFGDTEYDVMLLDARRDFCARLAQAGEAIVRAPPSHDMVRQIMAVSLDARPARAASPGT